MVSKSRKERLKCIATSLTTHTRSLPTKPGIASKICKSHKGFTVFSDPTKKLNEPKKQIQKKKVGNPSVPKFMRKSAMRTIVADLPFASLNESDVVIEPVLSEMAISPTHDP